MVGFNRGDQLDRQVGSAGVTDTPSGLLDEALPLAFGQPTNPTRTADNLPLPEDTTVLDLSSFTPDSLGGYPGGVEPLPLIRAQFPPPRYQYPAYQPQEQYRTYYASSHPYYVQPRPAQPWWQSYDANIPQDLSYMAPYLEQPSYSPQPYQPYQPQQPYQPYVPQTPYQPYQPEQPYQAPDTYVPQPYEPGQTYQPYQPTDQPPQTYQPYQPGQTYQPQPFQPYQPGQTYQPQPFQPYQPGQTYQPQPFQPYQPGQTYQPQPFQPPTDETQPYQPPGTYQPYQPPGTYQPYQPPFQPYVPTLNPYEIYGPDGIVRPGVTPPRNPRTGRPQITNPRMWAM